MTADGDGLLCFAVHIDGAMEVQGAGGERVTLPAYGNDHGQRAVLAAALLKRCDPDALVSVVVWTDDDEEWIARSLGDVNRADQLVAKVGRHMADLRREFSSGGG